MLQHQAYAQDKTKQGGVALATVAPVMGATQTLLLSADPSLSHHLTLCHEPPTPAVEETGKISI